MADFLLELLSEEIPARMQAKARSDLEALFTAELQKAGLSFTALETHVTPRRLALIARGLPAATDALREELKGPRTAAPPQALEGFLRKTGLPRDRLEDRGGTWFAVIDRPGRAAAAVLAEAVPAIVRAFPWPRSMRWGAASASTESLRWVRPLQGIVALLGEEIVQFEIAGISAGASTVGHRFHHPGIITIGGAHDYGEKLRACHVIVDPAERQRIIRDRAEALAAEAGLALVPDAGLVAENAGLTEWPVPLLGGFDPSFLQVPREVIQLTMRANQKYFACTDSSGALAPHFVCTANIDASDGGAAIVAGNERVLSARLSDAKFFWEQDLKVPLEEQAGKLSQIVFHEKLGTLADKVERIARLARWLVEEGIVKPSSRSLEDLTKPSPLAGEGWERGPAASAGQETSTSDHDGKTPSAADAAGPSPQSLPPEGGGAEQLAGLAERAARLCKADLVTGLVGEFPELQGVVGGHLARAQGEDPQVTAAISDHYKPVGQGDEVPTAPVTVAVSLADKLDTIAGFFFRNMAPTGSKDPFALRRAALGTLALITNNDLRLSIWAVLEEAFPSEPDPNSTEAIVNRFAIPALKDFFADRLKVQQREAGVRHDLIDAVFALGGEDDLVRLLARVRALQRFVETPDGADLLAGYKRAANILRKEGWPPSSSPLGGAADKVLSYTPEPEEAALIAALDSAEPRAAAAVAAEDFEGAMAALAGLRGPVDAFFDKVTVNDPDPSRRSARLDLLARLRGAFHRIADFSRIEG